MRRLLIIALMLALSVFFTGCNTSGRKCACKGEAACKSREMSTACACKKQADCTCKPGERKPECSCPKEADCTCRK